MVSAGEPGDMMKRIWQLVLIVLAMCVALPALAIDGPETASSKTGRRVALIIANGKYGTVGSLANPANDAKLVADSLKRAGFSSIIVRPDQKLADLTAALRDFRALATGADVALVYYAGHGIENDGHNFLIPVDARLASAEDLKYEAIDLSLVLETIGGAKVRMVLIDACRVNPFASKWQAAGRRTASSGLARLEVDDVLVLFAAAPGQVAADGNASNSPFAASLARRLAEPGLPVQLMGNKIRDDVIAATTGGQRPFVNASMSGELYYLVEAISEASQLRSLQDENRKLKELVAEQQLKLREINP